MSTLPKSARNEAKTVGKKQQKAVKQQKKAVKAAVKPTARPKMNTPSKEKQMLVGMKNISDNIKRNELALVSSALTARLPMQIPDGNGRRTMPVICKASFPLQGNHFNDTQYPSLVASDGTVAFVAKPSLVNTITFNSENQVSSSTTWQGAFEGTSGKNLQNLNTHPIYTSGSTGFYSWSDRNDGTNPASIAPPLQSKYYYVCPALISKTNPADSIQPAVTFSASVANTLSNLGYKTQAGQVFVATLYANTGGVVGFWNATTGAQIGAYVAVLATYASASKTVTVGTDCTAGDVIYPFFSNAQVVANFSVSVTASAGTTTLSQNTISMPQAADPLFVETFKQARVNAMVIWFENTSNIAQVGGDIGQFWLNPDDGANFQLPSANAILAAASSVTTDGKVSRFINGSYSFMRPRRNTLGFAPSLSMDNGYRYVFAANPAALSADQVNGFVHVFMMLEVEVFSLLLKGKISPDMPNVMAEYFTACSRIPNCCFENDAHIAAILGILTLAKSTVVAANALYKIPFVKKAIDGGVQKVYDIFN